MIQRRLFYGMALLTNVGFVLGSIRLAWLDATFPYAGWWPLMTVAAVAALVVTAIAYCNDPNASP